jgi:3-methylcrotonyl-CoA carboxylase alpha subunit
MFFRYVGAGTVEFLVDPITQTFYFCEMNTRLQVEHPVTEMVTGLDLVEWQLRVASGQPLPLKQEEVLARAKGCAVEARIYAENPKNGFLPSSGRLMHLQTSLEGTLGSFEEGVRVDTGVVAGNEVSTFYDPMIAKLIAYADTRTEALAKLERALRRYQVAGLANNIDFLGEIVRHPGFKTEVANTGFFNKYMNGILSALNEPTFGLHTQFGLVSYLHAQNQKVGSGLWSGSLAPDFADWRNQRGRERSLDIVTSAKVNVIARVTAPTTVYLSATSTDSEDAGASSALRVESENEVTYLKSTRLVSESNDAHSFFSVWENVVEINNQLVSGTTSIHTNKANGSKVVDVWLNGCVGEQRTHSQFIIPAANFSADGANSSNTLAVAPMPGKIVQVVAKEGQVVAKGDAIVILEAMKMEHVVYAPCAG